MVDAIVSFVVQRLGDYLIQEALLLHGVRNEVELLKNELDWMQSFIKDAEERKFDNVMIRKWVSNIRDIAYDFEDLLDTFMLEMGNGRTTKRSSEFFAPLKKCSCMFNTGKEEINLYSIGKEIEALRRRIGDLSRMRELYELRSVGQEMSNSRGRLKQLRRATSFAVEDNVVGFEDEANILLAKILEEEPRRLLLSVFGMGGLGKTTLARKLYHNNVVKTEFNCCAWISVSQDYNTKGLLVRIIESFRSTTMEERIKRYFGRTKTRELQKMSEEDLERYLHKSLQGCSYLVVMDDVWQKEAWESLKRAFPDNKNGSRIIMTTRIKEVAERSDEKSYAHKLRFLRPDESWQLFSKKAFQTVNIDEGLERLGREMVEKCGGLPLAIVVLGGLLSAKSPQEWHVVHDHIWRYLRNDSIHISHLFSLSFNDLTYQLKLCFLYLGLFPEDHEIGADTIIRLLIAEGFTPQDEDRSMEEVANDNLDELINRSLIQVGHKWLGMVQTYRIHDLLRDLSIQKAKELNFIHIFDETKHSSPPPVRSSCRRQSVYCTAKRSSSLQHCNPLSRSLLLFNLQWEHSHQIKQFIIPFCSRFRFLRVLNIKGYQSRSFEDALQHRSLPKEVGKLIHLKYLALNYMYIYSLPPSIGNLQSLQTLHLLGPYWNAKLPTEICKLRKLRHLIGKFAGSLPIENLTNIQSLKFVDYESWFRINPEKLVNLRELYIIQNSEGGTEYNLHSVTKLNSLRLLVVKWRIIILYLHCSHYLTVHISQLWQ